ncbi:alpha/beta hydrolase-fold protein [Flavobacterium sp. FlaQc-57]|uniref:alpha/beta hydrolase-fold protein n=1 Tax=Flavobacterium sp. FlaQc-57 TaxID=3374186 RepID=UPI0037579D05
MKLKLTIFFLFSALTIFGQSPDGLKEILTIKSKIYNKERKIAIYLPPNYQEVKNEKLQVVYVFDAQWEPMFNYVSNSISYLSAIGELNKMIVVGIYTENRPKEFVPMPTSEEEKKNWDEKPSFGFSTLLDQHLTEEVFPLIKEKYNTNDYKLAIGHSLGGTYLLNSFAENKHIFNSYIAISPNLTYDENEIQKKIKRLINSTSEINSFLNISVGDTDKTEKSFTAGIRLLDTILQSKKVNGLKFKFDYLKDATHMSSPFKEIPLALIEFSKTLRQPNAEEISKMLENKEITFTLQLKSYYQNISNWVGYSYLPYEGQLNNLAYSILLKDPDEGLNIINWALELYPNGINLYDSKAEILEQLNRNQEAKETLKVGLQKLEKLKIDKTEYSNFKNILEKHLNKN